MKYDAMTNKQHLNNLHPEVLTIKRSMIILINFVLQ